MSEAKVSGFTIVRNAGILNYPFEASVKSLLPLVDELVINCGDSDDDTASLCARLSNAHPKIRVYYQTWPTNGQGGFQLKHQTDFARERCRGDWCFYLQADEVLHELDYPAIQMAIRHASLRDHIDGILFDYVHFYGSYDYTIRGRNWYRREVRLFKNHRQVEAFRDAQGFRRKGNRLLAYPSGARVFHYGYVRDSDSLEAKSHQMANWWEQTPSKQNDHRLIRHVGLRRFKAPHPSVMAKKIQESTFHFDPKRSPRKWDKRELKNAATLAWETVFRFRIGEFRNYDVAY